LKKPVPLDVVTLIDVVLSKEFGFQTCIEFDHDFPDGTEAQLNIFKRTIEFSESGYDALCCGNPRSRFTGAHEAYHCIDHFPNIMRDGVSSLLERLCLCRNQNRTIKKYEDPEWQADHGAGALLMPFQTVLLFIESLRKGEAGRLSIVWEVANRFKVSEAAAETRLVKLGVIKNPQDVKDPAGFKVKSTGTTL
jgi:hypothetical protein